MVIIIKRETRKMVDDKGREIDGITVYDPQSPNEIEVTLHSSVFKDPKTFYEVLSHELDHASLYLTAERFPHKGLAHAGKHHKIMGLLDDVRAGAVDDLLK